jgi:hypothetical protein
MVTMQDMLIKCKRQLKNSTFTLEQFVPAGKAYLIPCPALKVLPHAKQCVTPFMLS